MMENPFDTTFYDPGRRDCIDHHQQHCPIPLQNNLSMDSLYSTEPYTCLDMEEFAWPSYLEDAPDESSFDDFWRSIDQANRLDTVSVGYPSETCSSEQASPEAPPLLPFQGESCRPGHSSTALADLSIQSQRGNTCAKPLNPIRNREGTKRKRKANSPRPTRQQAPKQKTLSAGSKQYACCGSQTSGERARIGNPSSPKDEENQKRIQARNRIAANKFRMRMRESAARLESDEEAMAQANRELHALREELSAEVWRLKMQLLKHTHCDCILIRNYLQNEAQRYVQRLDGGWAVGTG